MKRNSADVMSRAEKLSTRINVKSQFEVYLRGKK